MKPIRLIAPLRLVCQMCLMCLVTGIAACSSVEIDRCKYRLPAPQCPQTPTALEQAAEEAKRTQPQQEGANAAPEEAQGQPSAEEPRRPQKMKPKPRARRAVPQLPPEPLPPLPPVPSARLTPPPPPPPPEVGPSRPAPLMNCDAAGCWSPGAGRYNGAPGGPLLNGSGRLCQQQGGFVQCF